MRILILGLLAAVVAIAQQSIPSPATIGGVNCGELRLKEAHPGTAAGVLKVCRDAFDRLEFTFTGESATVATRITTAGMEQGEAILVFRPGDNGAARIFADYAGAGSTLELDASGSDRVGMFLNGGSSGSGGIFTLYHANTNPAIQMTETGIAVLTTGGTSAFSIGPGYFDVKQGTAPANPSSGWLRTYAKTGTSQLCTRDAGGNETCYGSATPGSGESFELPVLFTVSSAEKARIYNTSGNISMRLQNQYGHHSIELNNNGTTAEVALLDSGGTGKASIYAGGFEGATVELHGAGGSSVGAYIAGGTGSSGGAIRLYDSSGIPTVQMGDFGLQVVETSTATPRVILNPFGTIDLLKVSSPGSPLSGYGRIFVNTADQVCVQTSGGSSVCGGGSFVDLSTNQVVNGQKFFSDLRSSNLTIRASSGAAALGVFRADSGGDGYMELKPSASASGPTIVARGSYAGGPNGGVVEFFDPTAGSTMQIRGGSTTSISMTVPGSGQRVFIYGGSSTQPGTASFYDQSVVERVRINSNSQYGIRLFDGSGNQRLNIETVAGGGSISSPGSAMSIAVLGDSFGSSTFQLRNTTGTNGVIISTSGTQGDVSEFQLWSTSRLTTRMEGRPAAQQCGFGLAELQFGYTDTGGTTDFGLVATRNGACVPKSYPLRFRGSSAGYLDLSAPATVSTYSMKWMATGGVVGQCVSLVSAGQLGWASCSGGGGGSFVDFTSSQTGITGYKYFSNAAALTFALRNTSSASNAIGMFAGVDGSGLIDWWSSPSAFAPAVEITGSESSSGVGAILLKHTSTGADAVRIRGGGASGISGQISLNWTGSGGVNGTKLFLDAGQFGGGLQIYDGNGNLFLHARGIVGGGRRISVYNGLSMVDGYTGSISLGACTVDVVLGLITGKTGTC